jgi:hypothetical protein
VKKFCCLFEGGTSWNAGAGAIYSLCVLTQAIRNDVLQPVPVVAAKGEETQGEVKIAGVMHCHSDHPASALSEVASNMGSIARPTLCIVFFCVDQTE